jgi:hypothetical protein
MFCYNELLYGKLPVYNKTIPQISIIQEDTIFVLIGYGEAIDRFMSPQISSHLSVNSNTNKEKNGLLSSGISFKKGTLFYCYS